MKRTTKYKNTQKNTHSKIYSLKLTHKSKERLGPTENSVVSTEHILQLLQMVEVFYLCGKYVLICLNSLNDDFNDILHFFICDKNAF